MNNDQTLNLSGGNKKFAWLSAALIAAYTIRATIPGVFIAQSVLETLPYVLLIYSFAVLLFQSNKRTNTFGALLFVFAILSAVFSPYFDVSITRTVLWMLIFAVVGPLFSSQKINIFRNYLWQHSNYVIIAISVLSFFWNSLGLPLYGKGMAGVTVHCMLLGAIAGIASVLSFNNMLALTSRSFLSWGVFVASALSCLISGSRSAVAAAVMGMAIVTLIKFRGVARFMSYAMILTVMSLNWLTAGDGSGGTDLFGADSDLNPYVTELREKGNINSRETLWDNRIKEFGDNPIIGVGIGVDTFAFAGGMSGTRVIEPGSSYLAVLSMTGLLGSLSLILLLFSLGGQVVRSTRYIDHNEIVKVASLGAFWAMHAIAEGWIFAGGSILCLFFWIWVGRVATLGSGFFKESGGGL